MNVDWNVKSKVIDIVVIKKVNYEVIIECIYVFSWLYIRRERFLVKLVYKRRVIVEILLKINVRFCGYLNGKGCCCLYFNKFGEMG